MDPREKMIVSHMMIELGSSFEAGLGQALKVADPENAKLIKETWPATWSKFIRAYSLIEGRNIIEAPAVVE